MIRGYLHGKTGTFTLDEAACPEDRKYLRQKLTFRRAQKFLVGDYEIDGTYLKPYNQHSKKKSGSKAKSEPLNAFKDVIDNYMADETELRMMVGSKVYLEKVAKEAYDKFVRSIDHFSEPRYELTKELLNIPSLNEKPEEEQKKEIRANYEQNRDSINIGVLAYTFSKHFMQDQEADTNGILNYHSKDKVVIEGIDEIIMGSLLQNVTDLQARSILNVIGPGVSSIVKSKQNILPENGNAANAKIRRNQVARKWYSLMKDKKTKLEPGVNVGALIRTVSYANVTDVQYSGKSLSGTEMLIHLANNYRTLFENIATSKISKKDTINSFSTSVQHITGPYFKIKDMMGYGPNFNNLKKVPNEIGNLFARNYIARTSPRIKRIVKEAMKNARDSDFCKYVIAIVEPAIKSHLKEVLRFRDKVFQK